MKALSQVSILVALSTLFFSCTQDPVGTAGGEISTAGITLDRRDLAQGCRGADCIPSIQEPNFDAEGTDWIGEDDLVVGVVVDGQAYAYPYAVLNWHEVVNQVTSEGTAFTLSYCPLTSSSVAFRRDVVPGEPTFGVSGLLWRSNLIMYDRENDGLWSQMAMASVQGALTGTELPVITTFEMTFRAWRQLAPNSRVLTRAHGRPDTYRIYPYLDYWTNDLFFIPQSFANNEPAPPHYIDNRLPPKQRVHGIVVNGRAAAFPMRGLPFVGVTVQNGGVNSDPVVIVRGDLDPANPELDFVHSFRRTVGRQTLTFDVDNSQGGGFPVNLIDLETGTRWTILGEAIEGPLAGETLSPTRSCNAFWFAWAGFWEDTGIQEM